MEALILAGYARLVRAAPIAHWRMDNDPLVRGLVGALILAEYARWPPAGALP